MGGKCLISRLELSPESLDGLYGVDWEGVGLAVAWGREGAGGFVTWLFGRSEVLGKSTHLELSLKYGC